MQTRTSELRRTATELADRLAGTEHEQLAVDLRDAVVDLTSSVDAIHRFVDRGVSRALRDLAGPLPTPGPPRSGAGHDPSL